MEEEQRNTGPETEPDFSEDIHSRSHTSGAAFAPKEIREEFTDEALPDLPEGERISPHTPPRAPRRHTEPVKALNGISWKKKRRIARRDIITLNNGEPLSFAIRKIIVELIVILLCTGVVFGFFFAKAFVINRITNDGIDSLSMSTRYAAPQAVTVEAAANAASPGYACIQTVGNWAGVTVDSGALRKEYDGRDITGLADGMEKELARAVPGKVVTRKENLSNYTLITQIHDSLKKGAPVVVSCTARDGASITWALVTAVNAKQGKITLCYSDGVSAVLTAEDFIKSTRYESLAKKDLGTRLAMALGLYNKNTAFFFTSAEE